MTSFRRILGSAVLLLAPMAGPARADLAKLTDIEGVGPAFAKKLEAAGIKTPAQLLEAGSTTSGRQALAAKSGISSDQLLTWVHRADLARVKGVGGQYGELLSAAGVASVKDLARRDPKNLHDALVDVNGKKKLVRQLPSEAQVSGWIAEAKKTPSAVDQ